MSKETPIKNARLSFVCDKEWDAMQPCTSGRHCAACSKTVIDFTSAGMAELHKALETEEKVCGRFTQAQLIGTTGNQRFSFKIIAAGILLTLGFTSFSESLQAQAVNTPNRNPDNVQSQPIVFGMIQQTHPVYKHGGEKAMLEFIRKNLQQPPHENITGLVVTSFIIDTTGAVTEPMVVKSLSEKADKEALRVVKLLEFYPSKQDGKNVPIRYTLPIRFKADAKNEE